MKNITVSSSSTSSARGGIGFCGLLTVVFVALKLLGYISWSWWWVTAPIWIPAALAVIAVVVIGIVLSR